MRTRSRTMCPKMPVPSSMSSRWICRPNELAVVLELAALSLLHGAGLTALLGRLAHRRVL